MALLFIDSFDHYGTNILEKWSSFPSYYYTGNNTSALAVVGRRGTKGMRLSIGSGGYGNDSSSTLHKFIGSSSPTCIVGMAFRPMTPFTNNEQGNDPDSIGGGVNSGPCVIGVRNNNSTRFWLKLNSDGTISPVRFQTPIGVTSRALQQGVYTYVEMYVTLSTTVGVIKIYFNGDEVLNLTAQNTASVVTWNEIRLGAVSPYSGAVEWDYDDLYVSDDSGVAPWNDVLGDVRVDALYPMNEGGVSDWIPLSGTDNAAMVKEANGPDGDTTYVSTITPGAVDTYTIADLPSVGATLYGCQLNLYLKKEDAGACPLQGVTRVNGVNYPTTPVSSAGTGYAYRMTTIQANPATGLPWTEFDFNNAEFGIRRG